MGDILKLVTVCTGFPVEIPETSTARLVLGSLSSPAILSVTNDNCAPGSSMALASMKVPSRVVTRI